MNVPHWQLALGAALFTGGVAVGIRLQVPGLSPEPGAPAAPSATPLAGDALFSVIPAGKRASARPDIVLISVDTLRADVLGAYGDTRGLTPFLDQLAAKGTVFERAYASSSWTVPTVATMVTGLYAHQHGVDRGAFRNEDVHSQAPLPADFVVLAERLKGVGYRTLGVTTNAHLGGELGYLQGFDSYVNAGFEDAAFIDATVRDWAPMIAKGDQPVFLWLHYFDPHDPYTRREPYFSELEARSLDAATLAGPRQGRIEKALDYSKMSAKQLKERMDAFADPAELSIIQNLYGAEVRYTDEWIRRTLTGLQLAEDTLIIFTADHGEEFLDHGGLGHRRSLHNELMQVPFIVVRAGDIPAGKRVADPIRTVDLLPTILGAAGGDHKAQVGGTSGRNLAPLWRGESLPPVAALSTTNKGSLLQESLVVGDYKLIRRNEEPLIQLFNVVDDHAEKVDLGPQQPERVKSMLQQMDKLLTESRREGAAEAVQVTDPETLRMLEAMGYVDAADDH
jgi:arylsulfatase A-like enzyme